MKRKTARAAFIKSLPVFAGYIVLGIGFGVLLAKAGYGIWWALIMSLTMYAGTMQYVAVSLLSGGASFITTAVTALLVQARHLFYGISMIEKYKGAGIKKFYLAFALTDETYSLLCDGKHPEGTDLHLFQFLLSLFNQSYWIMGCLLGNFIGTNIEFNSAGIEFAMTAIFVTVFVEQWKSTKNHVPAIIGVLSTAVCFAVFGSENFLVPSMICITLLLFILRKPLEKKEEVNGND
ncbi:MAG: AzlC family ABC transporter permease [Clostridia bacterium]|nr:AzlC family ABC transporter permease [Clostridia bacterium]